jgi:DNA-binding IclR family transcriptional regulator
VSRRPDKAASPVKSAGRVLDVLETLARHTRPVPTMAIARECGIPKSSAHHLLNVMRDRNFVMYFEQERAWGLGVSVFEIGSAYLRSGPVQRLARPLLVELARRTGETSHLAMLHGTEVLYVDKETPVGNATQLVTEVGVRLPAHLTAVGRAILSELAESQVRALYADAPLVRRTGAGPTSIDALLAALDDVRARGYALDRELVTPGITCAAAPVFSFEGVPAAAIGITFLSAGRTDAELEGAVELVRATCARLSAALGYEGAPRTAAVVA